MQRIRLSAGEDVAQPELSLSAGGVSTGNTTLENCLILSTRPEHMRSL